MLFICPDGVNGDTAPGAAVQNAIEEAMKSKSRGCAILQDHEPRMELQPWLVFKLTLKGAYKALKVFILPSRALLGP